MVAQSFVGAQYVQCPSNICLAYRICRFYYVSFEIYAWCLERNDYQYNNSGLTMSGVEAGEEG